MKTIEQPLSEWAKSAFTASFPDADLTTAVLGVAASTEGRFGDYQCNAAMGLAKTLRMNPRAIAEAAVSYRPLPEGVERIEIAGPGFINFYLETGALAERMNRLARDPERLGVPAIGAGHTVVVDYSSPNVAKQMHVAHIRSTVIGNALDRLHRFLGFRVISDNHIGDWGTQFGILIIGYNEFRDEQALAEDPVKELERIYVESQRRGKTDEDWMDRARQELVKLQSGDPENRALWERFIELSMGEFDRTYDRLGVRFDLVRGESHYNDRLMSVVDELTEKGIATESEGAQVVFLEEEGLPVCIIRKSDGGANYATTDIATIESRIAEFKPDTIIYVTDERQQTHFKQVFAVARKLNLQTRLEHVWFGLMRLPEGTISTREGNVIKLHHLLDEAESRAFSLVSESSQDLSEEEQREVARAVGIGAVKYADLSMNPQSLVTFTWDKALALDGNSAPYLQYACARIASVETKYRERFPDMDLDAHPIQLGEEVERKLALQIARFPHAVIGAGTGYRPNLLADYLYELAQTYSSLYQNVPFLKAEEGLRESRVRLSLLALAVLRRGLDLLGIESPARM